VSKDEALRRFKATFTDLAGAMETVEANPLPASYEVRLQAGPEANGGGRELAAKLEQTPGVSDVRYDRQWLDRLLSAVTLVRGIGFLLGAFLTIAAALTVANVVRWRSGRGATKLKSCTWSGPRRRLFAVRSSWRACSRAGLARCWLWLRWR
jgi:cell division protein FtsX